MPSGFENDEKELVYLAGFFDGEGSIGVYAHNGTDKRPRKTARRFGQGYRARAGWAGTSAIHQFFTLRLGVAGNHRDSIERFQRRWGGTLTYVPLRPRATKPSWYWFASSRRAKTVLGDLLPYLNIKKAQAFEALKMPIAESGHNLSEADRATRIRIGERLKQMKLEVA